MSSFGWLTLAQDENFLHDVYDGNARGDLPR